MKTFKISKETYYNLRENGHAVLRDAEGNNLKLNTSTVGKIILVTWQGESYKVKISQNIPPHGYVMYATAKTKRNGNGPKILEKNLRLSEAQEIVNQHEDFIKINECAFCMHKLCSRQFNLSNASITNCRFS